MDVYVAPVPVTSAPVLVAEEVSGPARWSRDGRRIYYLSRDDTMMTLCPSALFLHSRSGRQSSCSS